MNPIPLILPLSALDADDLPVAGGKGANLGELTRAGFPVPPGFAVTTRAYDVFIVHNGLDPVISRDASSDPDGAAIRSAFESAEIPPDVEECILSAYQRLGEGPVAVRSSATAEDLPQAAFAGLQETFLNVLGRQALLDAVRRCWASLWTYRAIQYRKRQGVDPSAVKLAVVVQRMVAAEVAGVVFTANPVTGARDELVIDASPGLGEAVVSGQVTPDHTILRRKRLGWRVVAQQLGRRETVISALPGGGTQTTSAGGQVGVPALSNPQLFRLARMGRTIAAHFGLPQDIEWARLDGKLYILQSRPITALPKPPAHPGKPVQMLAGMFAEMFPVRPYPLDQSTWVPAISDAATGPIFSLIGLSVPSLTQFFSEAEGVVVHFNGKVAVRPTPGILLAPLRLLCFAARYDSLRWQADPLLGEGRARAQALNELHLEELNIVELLAVVREALKLTMPLAGEIRRRYYPRALLASALLRIVLALLRRGAFYADLLSRTDSLTVAANRALELMADHVRSDPTLSRIFRAHSPEELPVLLEAEPEGRSIIAELRAFLDRYGHREVVLSTVLTPTWKDAPDMVLGMIKGLASGETPHSQDRPAYETAQEKVLAHPLLRFPPFRAAFLSLLSTAQRLWQIREDTHFYATLILPVLRRSFLAAGKRLVNGCDLEAPEDIFHLKLAEIESLASQWPPTKDRAQETRALVQRRKEKRAALQATPMIDPGLYRQPVREEDEGDILLRGTPGSPGVVEAPSRVVRDVSEFDHLLAGEVLVAPFTNPSWTPLFQRASAVIVDAGAAGSHAAIVAREYGIPAVMGTIDGTQRLSDGLWVRVDGTRGLVHKTASHGEPP